MSLFCFFLTSIPQFAYQSSLSLSRLSSLFLSLVSLSLSDWQLNIDGLEVAEMPQMLSVLRRGQMWRTIKSHRLFSGKNHSLPVTSSPHPPFTLGDGGTQQEREIVTEE